MSCRESRNALALCAGGDLSESESRRLEEHLAECAACSAELNTLRTIRDQIRSSAGVAESVDVSPGFTSRVMAAVRNQSVGSRRPRRVMVRTGIALAGLVFVILLGVAGLKFRSLDQRFVSRETDVSAAAPWSEILAVSGGCLESPVSLADWTLKPKSAVLVIMHTASQDSSRFVIDYCGEYGRLRSWRGYPWLHTRERALFAHTGGEENVYIAVCYLEESNPQPRRELEARIISRYKPYFNTAKGIS